MGAYRVGRSVCNLNKTIYSKKSGIYKITCKANGKSYIGSARNLNKRIKAHIRMLLDNIHRNNELQIDWNTYGSDSFSAGDLKHCTVDELNHMELIYIEKFNSIENGYNSVKQGFSRNVGSSRSGKKNPMYGNEHKPESRAKISDFRKQYKGWKHSEETKKKQSEGAYKKWNKVPKKKYRARVRIDGNDFSLGSYPTREERDRIVEEFKEDYYKNC
jgi:group I intron endonuclease